MNGSKVSEIGRKLENYGYKMIIEPIGTSTINYHCVVRKNVFESSLEWEILEIELEKFLKFVEREKKLERIIDES